MARFALACMAVLWIASAGVALAISLKEGWDGFRLWVVLHMGWAGFGSAALAILLSLRVAATRWLVWLVLPFCILLFPVGPALALYAAYKLGRPEMEEFFRLCRERGRPPEAVTQIESHPKPGTGPGV
jgi:hypothetical protein